MKIKQDPITKLWCREDGAVCIPPTKYSRFKKYRWVFGTKRCDGYLGITYMGKRYLAHCIICRAFHGLPPEGKPEVDHISRVKVDNRSCNLRFVSRGENEDNKDRVDRAVEMYGVRECADRKAYYAAKGAKMKAQGLSYRKGPDGKSHWLPRIRP